MSFGADHDPTVAKKETERITHKNLPVLVGHNYEHVMGKATITQIAEVRNPDRPSDILEPTRVVITVEASGEQAQILGDFVSANEVVALSFVGVPVRPHSMKEK